METAECPPAASELPWRPANRKIIEPDGWRTVQCTVRGDNESHRQKTNHLHPLYIYGYRGKTRKNVATLKEQFHIIQKDDKVNNLKR